MSKNYFKKQTINHASVFYKPTFKNIKLGQGEGHLKTSGIAYSLSDIIPWKYFTGSWDMSS